MSSTQEIFEEAEMKTLQENSEEENVAQETDEKAEETMEDTAAILDEKVEKKSGALEDEKSAAAEVMEGDDNFPPKVTSEKEVLEDGVTKQLIKEGRGDKIPSKHSTCFLHYRGWVESTMHKFEDTWQEGSPMELVLGHERKQLRGLAIAIKSMKAGEHALFHIGWKFAYGEEGNFSFPNVPPRADVIYEVEFVGFEEAKEGRARGEMTVEERIAAADRRKVDGNELFKENKLEESIQQYEMALAYMGDDFMFQLYGKYKDMADAVKNPCHLNMAASLLKLEKYNEAIGHCTIVLTEDKNNVKALFRRGKARAALGQSDAAKEDFEKVRSLAPNDKAVICELRKIAEEERQLYAKQKELYKGLFGPAPALPPKRDPWYLIIVQWFISVFRYFANVLPNIKRVKND